MARKSIALKVLGIVLGLGALMACSLAAGAAPGPVDQPGTRRVEAHKPGKVNGHGLSAIHVEQTQLVFDGSRMRHDPVAAGPQRQRLRRAPGYTRSLNRSTDSCAVHAIPRSNNTRNSGSSKVQL